jgi:hypothetical protein
MTASTATETAAIHRHRFGDAGGSWLRSRFPTVRTLADGRRARQPAVRERQRFKLLDSDAWIDDLHLGAPGKRFDGQVLWRYEDRTLTPSNVATRHGGCCPWVAFKSLIR